MQSAVIETAEPSAEIMMAITSLRVQLGLAFRQRGTPDGATLLEMTVQRYHADDNKELTSQEFCLALSSLDVHVRKRDFRPFWEDARLRTESGNVNCSAVIYLINRAKWWPSRREVKMHMLDVSRVRGELKALLGPRIADALCHGQEAEQLRKVLAMAKAHPHALEELKNFLSVVPFESPTGKAHGNKTFANVDRTVSANSLGSLGDRGVSNIANNVARSTSPTSSKNVLSAAGNDALKKKKQKSGAPYAKPVAVLPIRPGV